MSGFEATEYAALMEAKDHGAAIAYVDRFRRAAPDDPDLRRYAALARGAKGEHEMGTYDQMQVPPPRQRLDALVALFTDATEIDPDLADPWWDLAVVHARFLGQPTQARAYLSRAQALGYRHPMMDRLEAMLHAAGT